MRRSFYILVIMCMLLCFHNNIAHAGEDWVLMPVGTIITKTVCIEGTVWLVSVYSTLSHVAISHNMEQVLVRGTGRSYPPQPIPCLDKFPNQRKAK